MKTKTYKIYVRQAESNARNGQMMEVTATSHDYAAKKYYKTAKSILSARYIEVSNGYTSKSYYSGHGSSVMRQYEYSNGRRVYTNMFAI